MQTVKFQRIHPGAVAPEYHSTLAAGFDLAVVEDTVVYPEQTIIGHTGLVIQPPEGHMLLIAPRSSTRRKWGITLANTVGILDEDYCGPTDEVCLLLKRDELWDSPYEPLGLREVLTSLLDQQSHIASAYQQAHTIPAGTRLAQGVFVPIVQAAFTEVKGPIAKDRGGFGSTG